MGVKRVSIKGLSDPKSIHLPGTGMLRQARLAKLSIPKPLDFSRHAGPKLPVPHPVMAVKLIVAKPVSIKLRKK